MKIAIFALLALTALPAVAQLKIVDDVVVHQLPSCRKYVPREYLSVCEGSGCDKQPKLTISTRPMEAGETADIYRFQMSSLDSSGFRVYYVEIHETPCAKSKQH